MAGVNGRLEARFTCIKGKTHLVHSFCSTPLKLAKTFSQDSGGLEVCVMDCSPGMMAGDRYDMSWHLEEGSEVSVTTQAFNKVHPAGGSASLQNQDICVARQATLEYLPQPTMLYAGANLTSDCRVDVAAGGSLLLSNILCAGRVARGESFAFERWQDNVDVYYDGSIVHCSRSLTAPAEQSCAAVAAWGAYTHRGSLCLVDGSAETPALAAAWRGIINGLGIHGGVSLLPRCGLLALMLGHNAWSLQQAVHMLVQARRAFAFNASTEAGLRDSSAA